MLHILKIMRMNLSAFSLKSTTNKARTWFTRSVSCRENRQTCCFLNISVGVPEICIKPFQVQIIKSCIFIQVIPFYDNTCVRNIKYFLFKKHVYWLALKIWYLLNRIIYICWYKNECCIWRIKNTINKK